MRPHPDRAGYDHPLDAAEEANAIDRQYRDWFRHVFARSVRVLTAGSADPRKGLD